MTQRNAWLMRSAASTALLALAACGGSGGGGGVISTPTPVTPSPDPAPPSAPAPAPTSTPTPAPAAAPAPTPTPTPVAINYDTGEYRATVGAVSMNALAGYQVGATGAGIGVGIIDTGIDLDSAEFGNRISSASQDLAGARTVDDEGGHGTAVAFTLAGRRNNAGTHGVAFDATLIVERADRPGSCATAVEGDDTTGCMFSSDAITRGIDAARAAGARVINISLGGTEMPAPLAAAIGRATAAGIVVVLAAGNDGTDNPDPFTEIANDSATARNQVIVAGSVGATDGISSFSDRAGTGATHFLAAVGERVRAPDQAGTAYVWDGTSFAAPQIAGAVALLAQAFPNLTGAQIVDILYRTARDAGAPGVDPVYGQGILDLARAFQPVGAVSLAGSTAAVSTRGNAVLSAPMGDAGQGELGAVILDGYGRAFAIDLAQTIARNTPSPLLAPALGGRTRAVSLSRGGMTASVTLAPRGGGDWAVERTSLTSRDALAARAVAATVVQRLGRTLSFGFGMAQGSGALTAQLVGATRPAFLIARDEGMGFDNAARASSAIRQQVGRFGITAAIESGDVLTRHDALLARTGAWRRTGFDRMALTLDRRFGALSTIVSASRLAERSTLLGARFDPSLGGGGATTWLADAHARFDAGSGWSLGGWMRQGWTHAAIGNGVTDGAAIRTGAFAADLGKDGVLGRDSLGLSVAQPLRVASGSVGYALPTLWDYGTGSVAQWTAQRLNLAPQGRELDVEARYSRPWLGGDVQTNLFWRRDPGNIAGLPDDYGMALRYSLGF